VSSKRRKLRRALLFWHPDHFHRSVKFLLTQQQQEALSCNTKSTRENSGYYSAGDREEDILSRARAVTRRIIAEKEALGLWIWCLNAEYIWLTKKTNFEIGKLVTELDLEIKWEGFQCQH